jgi:hypothetical protein
MVRQCRSRHFLSQFMWCVVNCSSRRAATETYRPRWVVVQESETFHRATVLAYSLVTIGSLSSNSGSLLCGWLRRTDFTPIAKSNIRRTFRRRGNGTRSRARCMVIHAAFSMSMAQ